MTNDSPISPREAVEKYGANQIEGATPGRLVLLLYDHVLGCIRRKDVFKAKKGIVELMASLNHDYLDVAGPLYRTYEYSLDIVREKKFDEAQQIFVELRDTWKEVVEVVESGSTSLETTQA